MNIPILEIRSEIKAIEQDKALYEEKNFTRRMEAIDHLEFHVIDRLEGLLQNGASPDELILLKDQAERVKAELEAIDIRLFQHLRENIRANEYTGDEFKELIREYVDLGLENQHQEEAGYDSLDIFINGLLSIQPTPEPTKDLGPEMVFYQKTPARVVFELAEKCLITSEDVFFDLGSGLGQVAMLMNLLTGVKARGIEFEPAFCRYAGDNAAAFNLSNVTFVNVNARKADYSEGTLFFLYTPFTGGILQEVLEMLEKEALLRKIMIITYGPCTAHVALQSWLHGPEPKENNIYKLSFFNSI